MWMLGFEMFTPTSYLFNTSGFPEDFAGNFVRFWVSVGIIWVAVSWTLLICWKCAETYSNSYRDRTQQEPEEARNDHHEDDSQRLNSTSASDDKTQEHSTVLKSFATGV